MADVVKAANYYRDQLGFAYDRFWNEPPDFCMVKRDGFIVMLAQACAGTQLLPHWKVVHQMWNAYFWCDDVESLHAEFVTLCDDAEDANKRSVRAASSSA